MRGAGQPADDLQTNPHTSISKAEPCQSVGQNGWRFHTKMFDEDGDFKARRAKRQLSCLLPGSNKRPRHCRTSLEGGNTSGALYH
jgi:hypothetical protein